jgi:hypothetical protein
MEYFHASTIDYLPDQKLSIPSNQNTFYFQRNINRGLGWLERLLEEQRPEVASPRARSLFAFDSIANAGGFIQAENIRRILQPVQPMQHWRIYQVSLRNPHRASMPILDFLSARNADFIHIGNAIQEYWNPQQNWRFFEYLSQKMEIIREVGMPGSQQLAGAVENWREDIRLAESTLI